MKRRDFLKVLGMASSATLLSSCGVEKGTEKLIPYLIPPEDGIVPGLAHYISSTCTECPANCGVSVKVMEKLPKEKNGKLQRQNSPIKLEGVAGHPVNDGALCLRGQSSIMRLYHPDRFRQPMKKMGEGAFAPISWDTAFAEITKALKNSNKKHVYLSGQTTGSLKVLFNEFSKATGVEVAPHYEKIAHANLRKGYRETIGVDDIPQYDVEAADVLVTFGADILETFISPVNFIKQITHAKEKGHFRWYHLEPHASLTGFKANKRFTIKTGSEPYVLSFLIHHLTANNLVRNRLPQNILDQIPDVSANQAAEKSGLSVKALNKLATALSGAKHPMVISGGVSLGNANGLLTASLTALLQWTLGLIGESIRFDAGEGFDGVGSENDMAELRNQLNNGAVGVVFLARTNPVGQLTDGELFGKALGKADLVVAISDLPNETTAVADIVLPLSHALESWGDAQPRKNILNVIQPTLEPLYDTRSEGDILLTLIALMRGQQPNLTYQEWLFARWKELLGSDAAVDEFLKKGYAQLPAQRETLRLNAAAAASLLKKASLNAPAGGSVLFAVPSLRMYDGRSKQLPLTPELPDPLTTITYGSWISVSDEWAQELGVKDKDEVSFSINNQQFKFPVKVQPGLNGHVATIHMDQIPANVLSRDAATGEVLSVINNVKLEKTGAQVKIPILAGSMEEGEKREIFPETYEDLEKELSHHNEVKATLYPEHHHPEYRWGMVIDLEKCVGCSACVAACYIENNVPMVGEEEHLKGREMSWIRIEPFYGEDPDKEMHFTVMLCQQCENAPCESVCPVFATMHNDEGLNVMAYNRCVGTRYCHNNCPYKVRRFNWFQPEWPETMERMLNPDVYVRNGGVMEKCTFCYHRIRAARDVAKDEKRKIRDGEVVPACAQTCPAEAITFGNLLDEQARVTQLAHSDRSFRALESMGVEPGVYYLRKEEIKDEEA